MRNVLTIALCVFFSVLTRTNAQKADEDAIRKVIQQETSSYFKKDYDKWADTWAKDSADFIFRAGPSGQSTLMGWNAISAAYKTDINNMSSAMDDADMATYMNKTGFNIYINGNIAVATFKEGNKMPATESRTLVKQNGAWKILNMTLVDGSYAFVDAVNNMKSFIGRWEYDGNSFTVEPNDSTQAKSINFELKQTANGLEQLSDASYAYQNQTYNPPTEVEYFIPDYGQNEIQYMDIQKSSSGQTYTNTGKATADQPNSFTVTSMYADKPTAIQYQYTVTLKDGKWHQVAKSYGRDGKLTRTYTFDLHRM